MGPPTKKTRDRRKSRTPVSEPADVTESSEQEMSLEEQSDSDASFGSPKRKQSKKTGKKGAQPAGTAAAKASTSNKRKSLAPSPSKKKSKVPTPPEAGVEDPDKNASLENVEMEEEEEEEGGIRIGDIYLPPPPPPACTFDNTGPRLVISHIENDFFKSYAGKQVSGILYREVCHYYIYFVHTSCALLTLCVITVIDVYLYVNLNSN